jgi:hypothetical protein
MGKLLFVFTIILFIGCKKSNPVSTNSSLKDSSPNSLTILVSPDSMFLDVSYYGSGSLDTNIIITNPSSSPDTLKGKIHFVDSSQTKGALLFCGYGFGRPFWYDSTGHNLVFDSTFAFPPGSSDKFNVLFTPRRLNSSYKASFMIYHNAVNQPSPIIVKIRGQYY